MSVIKPFKALRPQAQLAKQVASRPYDVLNSAEAKLEARGNHYSFLHITKSEIDLPESTDVHSQEVYDKAKENLQAFLKRDVLFQENKDCYYIYRLTMNERSQSGSTTKKAASPLHFAIASAVYAFYFLGSLDSDILGNR